MQKYKKYWPHEEYRKIFTSSTNKIKQQLRIHKANHKKDIVDALVIQSHVMSIRVAMLLYCLSVKWPAHKCIFGMVQNQPEIFL